jgi:hypothetical protein
MFSRAFIMLLLLVSGGAMAAGDPQFYQIVDRPLDQPITAQELSYILIRAGEDKLLQPSVKRVIHERKSEVMVFLQGDSFLAVRALTIEPRLYEDPVDSLKYILEKPPSEVLTSKDLDVLLQKAYEHPSLVPNVRNILRARRAEVAALVENDPEMNKRLLNLNPRQVATSAERVDGFKSKIKGVAEGCVALVDQVARSNPTHTKLGVLGLGLGAGAMLSFLKFDNMYDVTTPGEFYLNAKPIPTNFEITIYDDDFSNQGIRRRNEIEDLELEINGGVETLWKKNKSPKRWFTPSVKINRVDAKTTAFPAHSLCSFSGPMGRHLMEYALRECDGKIAIRLYP